MLDEFKDTLRVIYNETGRRFVNGEIKQHIGGPRYLTLLSDKLDRILKDWGKVDDELIDVAVDAAIALHLFVQTKKAETAEPHEEDIDDE